MRKTPVYDALFAKRKPGLNGLWEGRAWREARQIEVSNFRPEGSGHRPRTLARLLYDGQGIYCIFRVDDRYVRSVHTNHMDPVYKDSCVELFIRPKQELGYFNFEINCGGALLASYIRDHERTEKGFRDFAPSSDEAAKKVGIYHSLPDVVEPEIKGPVIWTVEFFIPFSLIERYVGPLGDLQGQIWTANFYKCGDETSHPHWASWAPLSAKNFHLPECFGKVRLAG